MARKIEVATNAGTSTQVTQTKTESTLGAFLALLNALIGKR